MHDNSENKYYSNYFQELEKRSINKTPAKHEQTNIHAKRPSKHTYRKKKHKFFKVIKIRLIPALLIILAVIGIGFGSVKIYARYFKGGTSENSKDSAVSAETEPPISYVYADNPIPIPDTINANDIIVVDLQTNKIIASRNPEVRAYPASTTKIMTLLVAVEKITDFNDTFTMSLSITDPLFKQNASVAGFADGEVITMTDMLYGTILPSGADAAMGLAIKIAGSEEGFVELMNKKVDELGLKNTHFTNVTGLFNENHYTTAYDMAVILNTALKNKTCKEILSIYKYTTTATPQHPQGIELSSTLFNNIYGTEPETATILGGKTGYVNESGYCIASYGKNNTTSNEYLIVTLGSKSRWPAFYGQIDLYKQFAQ